MGLWPRCVGSCVHGEAVCVGGRGGGLLPRCMRELYGGNCVRGSCVGGGCVGKLYGEAVGGLLPSCISEQWGELCVGSCVGKAVWEELCFIHVLCL